MADNSHAVHQPTVLRLSLSCDLAAVRPSVQLVRDFLAKNGWLENELMSFDLALVEACNNAIKYCAPSGRNRTILLEAVCEESHVEFRLHDHTPGFDWPRKIALPEPESESGRGLYLINSLMDYAGYFRGQGENILVMRKARPKLHSANTVEDPGNKKTSAEENERVISELVEELSSCYESLSAIFRYSADHSGTANPKEFAQRILGDLLQIVPADWFILRLAHHSQSRLTVFAASEPALELEPLTFPAPGKSASSTELQAALTRRRVWFDVNGHAPDHALRRAKPGSVGMVHPIVLGDQLVGTLALGRHALQHKSFQAPESVFSAGQANVVNTFADFLAIQIANSRLREEHVGQRLVSHELEIARNIQLSLLPASLPQLRGFSLAAFCRSAREVGGDFYDVMEIDADSRLLVIADVMGKGIPAAMFASILRALVRASPELSREPAALLARVNRLLFPDLSAVDMFITAQVAYVDVSTSKITVASAGHCPVLRATSDEVKVFSPEGMPLGIVADATFQPQMMDLVPNCRVLLYTDGVTDALNPKNEFFTQQRLKDWLRRASSVSRTADELRDELAHELAEHQTNATLNDDQTFLILAG